MDSNNKTELKAFQERVFASINRVEQWSLKLFELDSVLENICSEVQSSLGFDFTSLSLISLERDTIEAVCGTGIAKQWSDRFKHHLEQEESLRDIQSDIAMKNQAEIISGWDNRFDGWVYEHYRHDRLVRVFVPIILFKNHLGELIEDVTGRSPILKKMKGSILFVDSSYPKIFQIIFIIAAIIPEK